MTAALHSAGGCPPGTGGPNCEECKANYFSPGGRAGQPRPKCKPCGLHFHSPAGSISAEYCECGECAVIQGEHACMRSCVWVGMSCSRSWLFWPALVSLACKGVCRPPVATAHSEQNLLTPTPCLSSRCQNPSLPACLPVSHLTLSDHTKNPQMSGMAQTQRTNTAAVPAHWAPSTQAPHRSNQQPTPTKPPKSTSKSPLHHNQQRDTFQRGVVVQEGPTKRVPCTRPLQSLVSAAGLHTLAVPSRRCRRGLCLRARAFACRATEAAAARPALR
jgi:hypothetical protein